MTPKKVPVTIPLMETELLKSKNIVVTGGGSGIGYAIAKSCLLNGANVVITGRNQEKLNQAVLELKALKDETDCIWAVQLDLDNCSDHKKALEMILQKFPNNTIDILINNAGIQSGARFGETVPEDFDKVISTNLKGTYFWSQIVANDMREKSVHGNILNVCSSSSNRPAVTPYMLSKWGEAGLTKGMAKQLIKYGIVVNGIAPGPTAGGMLERLERIIDGTFSGGCDHFHARSPRRSESFSNNR